MKRSALFHLHQRLGAVFGEYDGWALPARFGDAEAEAMHVDRALGLADVSGGMMTDLVLAGPRCREVLSKLTSLNIEDVASAQASVAHVHCTLVREDLPHTLAYRLSITRDYAESFWDAVMHAGHEFQITAFGWEALQLLRGQ